MNTKNRYHKFFLNLWVPSIKKKKLKNVYFIIRIFCILDLFYELLFLTVF